MKLYVLHKSIDLGSHVIGIFSSEEKYNKAFDMYKAFYTVFHKGLIPDLFQEVYEVDSLDFGHGDKKTTVKL